MAIKISNFRAGFDAHGGFKIKQLFTAEYNLLPQSLIYRVGEQENFDLNKVTREMLKEIFPDSLIVGGKVVTNKDAESSNDAKIRELFDMPEDSILQNDEWINTGFNVFMDRCYIEIDTRTICVYYDAEVVTNVNDLVADLITKLPKEEEAPEAKEIDLVCFDSTYYTTTAEINEVDIDLEKNYNDGFVDVANNIKDFITSRNSGVAILKGSCGTGKTSYLRHLMNTTPAHYIYITPAIAANLASPDLTSFLLSHKNSVFILEDCENVVMSRESNATFGGALSTILNMSDGLMSDIFNGKFICTYNTSDDNVDEALLRPGRCAVNYEFGKLSEEKTRNLLKELGHDVESPGEMTLAEIYNYGKDNGVSTKEYKLGY